MKHLRLEVSLLSLAFALLSRSPSAFSFDPPASYATGHVPEPMVSADLDGDGNIDLAVACTSADYMSGGNIVMVFLGQEGGTFDEGVSYAVGIRPESLVLCKADSDENVDIVTSNFGDELTPGDGSLSVLLGNGDGTFDPEIRIPVPHEPRTVVAADFNGDGNTDLAATDYDFDSISIYLGDGTGSFAPTKTISVGNGPEHLAVLRLDADGIPDLLVANRLDRTFTPMAGDGTGDFATKTPGSVGRWPRFVLGRDLDGDGLDDAIISNYLDNDVHILRNRGDYTFETELILSYASVGVTLEWPLEIELADITRDGHDDLLVTWAESSAFTVSPGSAASFDFQPSLAVQTGSTPVGIEAVDFDKDGAIDVAVAEANADTLSVFLSSRGDPGTVVDNDTAGTTYTGSWSLSVAPFAYGTNSLYCSTGGEYRWEADLPSPGYYEAYLWWTVTTDRETAAAVQVLHLEGTASSTVDQTQGYGFWHSLGTFLFGDTGVVVLASQGGAEAKSVSADAVRFRFRAPVVPGTATFTERPRPDQINLSDGNVIAFHGNVAVQNDLESGDWLSATFEPIGAGEESTRITEARLYVDSNGNKKYDITDFQIGSTETFPSETQALTFDGFQRQVSSGSSVDFFVVCTVEPAAVVTTERLLDRARPALAAAFIFALLPVALWRKKALMRLYVLAILLAPLGFFVVPGCGGGGGGGGDPPPPPEEALQIQMTSASVSGSNTGVPASVDGLPVSGWTF